MSIAEGVVSRAMVRAESAHISSFGSRLSPWPVRALPPFFTVFR